MLGAPSSAYFLGKKWESKNLSHTQFIQYLTMPHHSLSPRQYMILALVAICAPLGDTCLSRGMTTLPAISLAHPITLIAAVFTPWIALGIALLIGFFASYLTALSWADLTFVLPATAFGNVIVALFARFWLHESISWQRWLGVVLITVGVGFVAHGPSLTVQPTVADSPIEPRTLGVPHSVVSAESELEKEQVR